MRHSSRTTLRVKASISVVSLQKLMTRLAAPHAGPHRVERVLDGWCGTGGFLIEALTDMRRRIYDNTSLKKERRAELLNEIANEAIFGIDAGREPPLARIARINMYLHGDGGSRIYLADGLEQLPTVSPAEQPEIRSEVEELRRLTCANASSSVELSRSTGTPSSVQARVQRLLSLSSKSRQRKPSNSPTFSFTKVSTSVWMT